MKRLSALLLIAALFIPSAFAQTDADGIRGAVLDYVEGFYNAEPERFDKSLSKDLVKYGYWQTGEDTWGEGGMTFDSAKSFAARWNADNNQGIDENSPKEIVILDQLDKVAVAKLTAVWGIDYFQLEKIDGTWKIRHVIWQTAPHENDHDH